MSDNINNLNYDFLRHTDLSRFDQKQSNKRLAIVGNKVQWLSAKEIKEKIKHGDRVISNMDEIARVLKKTDFTQSNLIGKLQISKNLKWIDSKLAERNQKHRSIPIFDRIFKRGHEHERLDSKAQDLDKDIEADKKRVIDEHKRIQEEEAQKQREIAVKQREEAKIREEANGNFVENVLADLPGHESIAVALFEILEYNDHSQCQYLQLRIALEPKLLDQLIQNMQKLPESKTEARFNVILNAFIALKNCPPTLHKEKGLLGTLFFIEQNRDLMRSGEIGVASKHEPGMRKIKRQTRHTIIYDEKTGAVASLQIYVGKGAFKVVKKRIEWSGIETEAVSRQRLDTPRKEEMGERETKLMEECRGLENVVQLRTVTSYESKSGVQTQVMRTPFYNMGPLDRHLETLDDLNKLRVAVGSAKGLVGIHSRGIIHRDIKPANIFLQKIQGEKGEEVRPVIGDLGLACWVDNDPERKRPVGTPFYMPLEALRGHSSDFDSDAWSFGLTLSKLFFGYQPYDKFNPEDTGELKIAILRLEDDPPPSDQNSIEFVIWKLTRPNFEERMTIEEALPILENLLSSAEKKQT